MRIVVTGGRGDLGRRVVPRLVAAGHEVWIGTRTPRSPREVRYDFDLPVADLERLLDGVDTVVHLASQPRRPHTDVVATQRLLEAAARTGVGHLLYVSIVGIEHNPFRYYQAKLAAEQRIAASPVPWTILRAAQFHSLLVRFAEAGHLGPLWVVPRRIPLQPVDPEAVADRVVELVAAGPSGRVPDLFGPEVIDSAEAVRRYRAARGARGVLLPLPLFGAAARSARAGCFLPGDQPAEIDTRTFDAYLAAVAGSADTTGDSAAGRDRSPPSAGAVGAPADPGTPSGRDDASSGTAGVAAILWLVGWSLLATAVWMAAAPAHFLRTIASFGSTSPHFLRDLATSTGTLGVAALLAVSRPAWQVPVLALATLQNSLHLVNHLADVGGTDPGWHGPANAALLGVLELVLIAGLVLARRRSTVGPAGPPA